MAQHSHDQHEHGDGHHGVGHVVPIKYLVLNGLALLVLTWVTVAIARFDFTEHNIYELNIIGALTVATIKATLVCLFFMHLYWDRPFNSFVLVGSIAFVALFIGLAMLDTFEYSDSLIRDDPVRVQEALQQRE